VNELGESGDNLNRDIAELVKKGLEVEVQQRRRNCQPEDLGGLELTTTSNLVGSWKGKNCELLARGGDDPGALSYLVTSSLGL